MDSFGKSIPILYEDEQFVVFDKPAGLLVVPTPKKEKNTLVNIVNHQYGKARGRQLFPCHRIDRETSGIVIFAWGKQNQEIMMALFKKQLVKKKYLAVVRGKLKQRQGELRSYIKDFDQRKHGRHEPGKLAITRYRVMRNDSGYSVVEVEPVTGRTNQIRIHFAEIGHPLVGDRKYSFARDYALKFRRTALHAWQVAWRHPVSKNMINIQSEVPKDMEVFLGRYSDSN